MAQVWGGEQVDKEVMSRRFRSWMVEAGMTQEQTADALGVSVGTLKSWVYGTRSLTLDRAVQVCDLFGKPLDELAGRDHTPVLAL